MHLAQTLFMFYRTVVVISNCYPERNWPDRVYNGDGVFTARYELIFKYNSDETWTLEFYDDSSLRPSLHIFMLKVYILQF
jgi:hypothetical protein